MRTNMSKKVFKIMKQSMTSDLHCNSGFYWPRKGMETRFEGTTMTKVEEGAVFESRGGKRPNEDKDSCLAKRAKEEGESASDGTKEEEGEEEANDKVVRLRGLLAYDPKKLSNKDVEEVINCLNVDEIISLALESRQKGSGDGDDDDGVDCLDRVEKWDEGEEWHVKALDTVRSMLGVIEVVEPRDIRLVYEKWPPEAFATVLLSALDSLSYRSRPNDPFPHVDYYDIIPKLCSVLPFSLFVHILREKEVFDFDEEIDEEETRQRQKEAAEGCDFCFGKAEHTGIYGENCTLMETVIFGTRIPAGYCVKCKRCGEFVGLYDSTFEDCSICGCDIGRAVSINDP